MNISPTPNAYFLFFKYFERSSEEMNRRLDEITNSGAPITDDAIYSLYLEYCLSSDESAKTSTLAGTVAEELEKLMDLIEGAGRNTSDYQNSLEEASGQLVSKISAKEVRDIVARVFLETQSVVEYSRMIEEKLSESALTIDGLYGELESVRREATTDALTGLANRSEFQRVVLATIAAAAIEPRDFSLLIVDIDHFKNVNDTYGHPFGDKVLKRTATSLKSNVKGKDLAARYGGEEFAIYLADATQPQAMAIAEALRKTVSAQAIVNKTTGERSGNVTVSIGVATYRPGRTLDDLIDCADRALYHAKKSGRNRVSNECDVEQPLDPATARASRKGAASKNECLEAGGRVATG